MENLVWLLAVPFISSFIVFALPSATPRFLKTITFLFSLLPLAILLYSQNNFNAINYSWFPGASINFHLAVDPLSLLFIYLAAVIVPISLLSMRSREVPLPNIYYGLILLLQALLIGFFTARDLAVFTIFYEAMLLPLYFIITLWGGEQRQMAAMKFLIYMLAGSALMIAAVLALFFVGGTFDIDSVAKNASPWLCAAFFLAFAVKTPLFPFHGWLPDAYYQAPTAGTILLSALLSKAGIYGFLRVSLEIFPTIMRDWSPFLLSLAIAGVFYGALAAWMQNDFKRLLAYSSFSHVNFILAGIFVWQQTAQAGAIVQAINHGITITALFLVSGWLEQRIGTTHIGTFSGLAKFLPHLCWLTLIFVLSSVALPGTNSFIGEIMILFGLFEQYPYIAAFLAFSVILSVVYMLRWMQKIYFEAPSLFQNTWVDIRTREFVIATPLILLILWIGIYPAPILRQAVPAAETIEVSP